MNYAVTDLRKWIVDLPDFTDPIKSSLFVNVIIKVTIVSVLEIIQSQRTGDSVSGPQHPWCTMSYFFQMSY